MGWKREEFQPECCEADFGSRIKILGYPLGRSASFFELHLFRLVPGLKIDFFEKLPQVSRVADMVAAKNCSNFWGEFKLLGPKSKQIVHECCEADFGSRIKILGHPLGQSASFFEIYLFRPVLASPPKPVLCEIELCSKSRVLKVRVSVRPGYGGPDNLFITRLRCSRFQHNQNLSY